MYVHENAFFRGYKLRTWRTHNLSHTIRENEPVTHPRLSSCNIGTILPVTHGEHKSHCAEYRFIINGADPLREEEGLHHEKKILLPSILEITLSYHLSVDYFSRHLSVVLFNFFSFSNSNRKSFFLNHQYHLFLEHLIYAT